MASLEAGVLTRDRDRALALAALLAEDLAVALNVAIPDLSPEHKDLAEAVGMFVFATGKLEKTAATGALVYTAARLP